MNMGLIRVNIHYTGKIPWLNIQGPRYDIGLSASIYRLLSNDPRISVYPVDNDPVMAAMKAAKKAAEVVVPEIEPEEEVNSIDEIEINVENAHIINIPKLTKKETSEEPIEEEVVTEDIVVEFPDTEPMTTNEEPEEVIEEEIQIEGETVTAEEVQALDEVAPEVEFVEPTLPTADYTAEDMAIEAELENEPEEDDDDDIIFSDDRVLEIVQAYSAGFPRYEKADLLEKTKAELKAILNDEREFAPATEFYGRYHDNHDVLLQKILDSQL